MVELPQNKKWVYLYNTNDTTHPYVGNLMVDKDDPLMAGQTDVEVALDGKKHYFNDVKKQWVDEVVLTYEIKEDKSLGQITRRPAGYALADNETFVKPEDGIYDPTWNGSSWVGITKDEYYKKHPVAPVKPTAQDQAMADLLKDAAQFKTTNTKQDTLNAQLLKDLMAEKQKSVKQDTLNAQLLKDVASLKLQLKTSTTTA